MRDCVYEEKSKGGLTVKIYPDDDAQGPEEWGDDGLFLVGYHRDFTVDRGRRDKATGRWVPGIEKGLAVCIANKGLYEDGSINEEAKDYLKRYHVFGLEAYIHSGVRLALAREGNFPDRAWDVSQLGLVFAAKSEWKTRAKAEKAARGLIESWNEYLSGNVYGFVVEDENGEHLDSCWGFYVDYEDGALKEGRDMAEYHYKEMLKKKAAKTKAYIRNAVPLEKRRG